jgi:hypothetical protein
MKTAISIPDDLFSAADKLALEFYPEKEESTSFRTPNSAALFSMDWGS